jgi:transcription antitermination factor NusG
MEDSMQWFVVRSKPRREDYAQDQLARRGVDTFLPRIMEQGRSNGEPLVGPLFPGYLFARIDLASQYTRVIWAPGVRSLVSFGDLPCAVDPDVVDFLRERCGAEGVVHAVARFDDGDVVRVRSGPLSGLVGVVQARVSGRCRVRVLMEILRRRTQVSVPIEMLEHVAQ